MAVTNKKLTSYYYEQPKYDYDYPSDTDLKWNPEYLGERLDTLIHNTPTSELDRLQEKYNKLVNELASIRHKAKKDVRSILYEEELEEMRLYARSEVFANLEHELREQFLNSEAADDVYLEVRASITAEVREEIRQEILADMQKAKDRI